MGEDSVVWDLEGSTLPATATNGAEYSGLDRGLPTAHPLRVAWHPIHEELELSFQYYTFRLSFASLAGFVRDEDPDLFLAFGLRLYQGRERMPLGILGRTVWASLGRDRERVLTLVSEVYEEAGMDVLTASLEASTTVDLCMVAAATVSPHYLPHTAVYGDSLWLAETADLMEGLGGITVREALEMLNASPFSQRRDSPGPPSLGL